MSQLSPAEVPVLLIEDLRKAYGPTQALKGLSLASSSGKIVGIVGGNGAGKSTLMKILAGEEREDSGVVRMNGRPCSQEERRRSVAVVHQEPQLFPNLTIAENLMIENAGLLRPRPTAKLFDLLRRLELEPLANTMLERTSIVVWQRTEIARALLREAQIFLFDEPNSALTKEESHQLFEQMSLLRSPERFIFLVSHRLGEVAEICEEVHVVRDGTMAATLTGAEVTSERLSSLLTAEAFGPTTAPPGAVGEAPTPSRSLGATAEPEDGGTLTRSSSDGAWAVPADRIAGVPGVILAVTGPEGGGGRELTRAAPPSTEPGGEAGSAAETGGPRHGSTYMPSDRQKSLFFNMSVAANISARLERKDLSARRGLVSRRMLAGAAESYIERFGIKAAHAGASVASLSGGNQQKVALASALAVDPALLIIEEPTRGVDLQTKRQIYDILKRFAASGGAVVMYVTELEDAIGCADHLYVVRDQTIVGLVEVGTAGGLEKLGIAVTRLLGRDADAA